MFNAANFPGAQPPTCRRRSNLYALLTGRISRSPAMRGIDEATGEYEYMGTGRQNGRMREGGVFVQDSGAFDPT